MAFSGAGLVGDLHVELFGEEESREYLELYLPCAIF